MGFPEGLRPGLPVGDLGAYIRGRPPFSKNFPYIVLKSYFTILGQKIRVKIVFGVKIVFWLCMSLGPKPWVQNL